MRPTQYDTNHPTLDKSMSIFFFIALVIGLFLGKPFGSLIPLFLASIYAVGLMPGFFAGKEINQEDLTARLNSNWNEAPEIAAFIVNCWCSIKYIRSAASRGGHASVISLASFGLAAWLYYSDHSPYLYYWSLVNGITLWIIGNFVNRALYLAINAPNHPMSDLACASLLAASQVTGDDIYMKIVSENIDADRFESILKKYHKLFSTAQEPVNKFV
jgi:hypothetical protein